MRSIEWIIAENEKFNRPDTQPTGEPFVVTKDEAAAVYSGYIWCDVEQTWYGDPCHYYNCDICRNDLIDKRNI